MEWKKSNHILFMVKDKNKHILNHFIRGNSAQKLHRNNISKNTQHYNFDEK